MEKSRLRAIADQAIPIIGGMASQNVMNLVDTWMIGGLGRSALAAVGIASFANFLAQAFLTGLGAGVQAMAARRLGEGHGDDTAAPLHAGLVISLLLGLPISVLLVVAAPHLFPLILRDPEVIAIAVPYFQVRVLAAPAVGMNFCFRGYYSGVSLSRLYMRTLVPMHIFNMLLSWTLIHGHLGLPQLGATGSAWGTTIASFLGTATYAWLGWRHARSGGFLRARPTGRTMRQVLRLSFPTGLQQMFFAAGLVALFAIVGRIGTAELAAANVLMNVTLVGILPGLGLGLACASLVGQALGRKDVEDARRWGWDVVKVAVVVLMILSLPMLVAPIPILSIFVREASTLAVAESPLRLVGAMLFVDAIGLVLQNALLGAGDSRRVALLSVGMQWLLFLPAAFVIGPVMGLGLTAVWIAQAAYRAVQSGILIAMWRGDRWTTIKV
jgi:MATE family multidrug resistance protein